MLPSYLLLQPCNKIKEAALYMCDMVSSMIYILNVLYLFDVKFKYTYNTWLSTRPLASVLHFLIIM